VLARAQVTLDGRAESVRLRWGESAYAAAAAFCARPAGAARAGARRVAAALAAAAATAAAAAAAALFSLEVDVFGAASAILTVRTGESRGSAAAAFCDAFADLGSARDCVAVLRPRLDAAAAAAAAGGVASGEGGGVGRSSGGAGGGRRLRWYCSVLVLAGCACALLAETARGLLGAGRALRRALGFGPASAAEAAAAAVAASRRAAANAANAPKAVKAAATAGGERRSAAPHSVVAATVPRAPPHCGARPCSRRCRSARCGASAALALAIAAPLLLPPLCRLGAAASGGSTAPAVATEPRCSADLAWRGALYRATAGGCDFRLLHGLPYSRSRATPPTHYAVLGVTPAASRAALKRRFRELSLRLHPDKQAAARARKAAAVMRAKGAVGGDATAAPATTTAAAAAAAAVAAAAAAAAVWHSCVRALAAGVASAAADLEATAVVRGTTAVVRGAAAPRSAEPAAATASSAGAPSGEGGGGASAQAAAVAAEAAAAAEFIRVRAAYSALVDEGRRRAYDAQQERSRRGRERGEAEWAARGACGCHVANLAPRQTGVLAAVLAAGLAGALLLVVPGCLRGGCRRVARDAAGLPPLRQHKSGDAALEAVRARQQRQLQASASTAKRALSSSS
jgi:curved DNA-binding protein CbpA